MSSVSLENAAAQMNLCGFRYEGAELHETDWKPAVGRYKILKAASPRILFWQRFSNGFTALAQRVLTWVQGIFSSPGFVRVRQQVQVHSHAGDVATVGPAITFMTEKVNEVSSQPNEYIALCNESIQALQLALSENNPAEFTMGLARFCECRRRIAALDSGAHGRNGQAADAYFNTLRRLIEPGKEKLAEFLEVLAEMLLVETPSKNPRCDPRYAHAVLSDLLVFAYSKSGTSMSL